MGDDKTLQRLLRGEVHKMNQDLADPIDLRDARDQDEPKTRTKVGVHHFDKEALERFAAGLSPLVRHTVRVPIRFYVPHDMRGECYLAERESIEAVQQLGGTPNQPRDGRLWMSFILAQDFARRYPTVVQFVRQ